MAAASPGGLPNADHAVVEQRRIREYLLNPTHPSGGPKANFFMAYGFAAQDRDLLRAALIQHGRTNSVVRSIDTAWGMRYTVACNCITPDGRNPCIRTVWQMERGVPRLLTCIPRA
jgi:hypothetical protein